ncbi:MAG: right-handed parallel beta-helix repeat-containing protein, partial [Parvularcula sp.]|nr:right-handed parallel beta-helix repeat-containing protein [Parvularcula sp.]
MATFTQKVSAVVFAASGLALLASGTALAQDGKIGGFETELPKPEKKKEKIKKRPFIDVRVDAGWDGPRSISEALDLVEENGTIAVHYGNYPPDNVRITKNVTIEGKRDNYGKAPVIPAKGGCLSVSKDEVRVRVTDLVFKASDQSCVTVSGGSLEMVNSEVHGKGFGPNYLQNASIHMNASSPFSLAEATGGRSALVSVSGGRVTLERNQILGGETGVMITPQLRGNGFENVTMTENVIAGNDRGGVVLTGSADAILMGNTVVGNGLGGVIYAGAGHARLVSNKIAENGHDGIYVASGGDWVTLQGNTISANGSDGVEVAS